MSSSQPNQTCASTKDNDFCQFGDGLTKEVGRSPENSLSVSSFNSCLVDKNVWDSMPPELKVACIDVLILYNENDRQSAAEFRDHLVNHIQLQDGEKVRALLYDEGELFALNNRKIGQLSDAMNRSTYVFIYLTKEFVNDKWMEFSSEVCLMEAIENPDKQWCVVPVLTEKRNGTFKIPAGLNILNGLYYYKKDQYYLKQLTCLIESRIQTRKNADAKLKIMQMEWISTKEKTTYASYSETNNESTEIKSSKPCNTQPKMCYSNEEPTLLKSTLPTAREYFVHEAPETERNEQHYSEPSVSTISTLHCDMAMSSPMPRWSDSTNLPSTSDEQSHARGTAEQKRTRADATDKAGNMCNFTDVVSQHSPPSRYPEQAADQLEPNSSTEIKDQRGKGQKKEAWTTDDRLYQSLNLRSFEESDRSISDGLSVANGGENQTRLKIMNTLEHEQSRSHGDQYNDQTWTNGTVREAELIPQFGTLLNSDSISSWSEAGNQSKPCSDNIADHMRPQTPTDVNQNEYVDTQGPIPLLSAFCNGTSSQETKSGRDPCNHEPINDSTKINRQAAVGLPPVVHNHNYNKTVIKIYDPKNVQIGDHNVVREAYDSDDESNSDDEESQTNQPFGEELQSCENRNDEPTIHREFEVVPSQDVINNADDDHMISALDKNDSCTVVAATKRVETCTLNDTAVKEDSGEEDFTKESVRGRTCESFWPRTIKQTALRP